ncbi:MAG TPA: universal stress protein [Planctomycetota bacterium]|nr:universal stress protein [Planctomycetota bacterium]
MSFETLILTTDLSENAEAATPLAVELARNFGSKIYLLHVFEDPPVFAGMGEGLVIGVSDWLAESHRATGEKLEQMARTIAEREKVQVLPVILRGDVLTRIVEFAQSHNVSCIVTATHGRTGFSRALNGSVAEKIVRMSPCPVLSIRPAAHR